MRDGRAPAVYQQPADFFERTYLTKNLAGLAAEVSRRLSGIKVETSAVFNMTTQFGGGKTHSLTLLYHLARGGPEAAGWKGVRMLLETAGVTEIPRAATGVFVGTEFDSIAGRGGADGTPVRKTPWGEIAWQLGGAEGLRVVAEHDASLTAPGGDVVARILPADRPALILLDELMNYVSRSRKSGLGGQLYNFLHNLSEVARSRDNVVLAVSIPASELEMTAEDQSDYERLKKLLDRLGKAVIMSVEAETAEIIRRRLFEWHGLPADASKTVGEYAEWMAAHRHQLPSWFPVDNARKALAASYPFHPSVLSVFERKWQALPRFQQTRGILRLLALWVSHAYVEGFKGAHKDPLITLGTVPLDNPTFRAAVFEQLGESRLEGAVTTDIAGKEHAHALRLDKEATAEVRKARFHRKVATAIFFESNGGQQRGEATLPEVRLAVAEPDLDIGNVEQSLEALADTCYFLSAEKTRYRFSFQPNLNKLLADRRASVPANATRDRVRAEIHKVVAAGRGVERIYFPERTNQVPDRAALTLVLLAPENEAGDPATIRLMEMMLREHGSSSRTYKSALLWCAEFRLIVPDLRGHGRSTNPSNKFTHKQAALDIFALLDHLGLNTFRAMGTSTGGMTLLHMATTQPERAEAIVLIGATSYFPDQARDIMRATDPETAPEQAWTRMRQRHTHGDEQIRALWTQFHDFEDDYDDMNFTAPYLSSITARTLIVHGDRDRFFPVDIPVAEYEAIPNSYLWIVPNGGHVPIRGAMAEHFRETALAFLRGEWEAQ